MQVSPGLVGTILWWVSEISFETLYLLASTFDPDQAQQNITPDLDPKCLTLWLYFWKNFSKKLILKKISRGQKSGKDFPGGKEMKELEMILSPLLPTVDCKQETHRV